MTPQELIASALCPGCVSGISPEECPNYKFRESEGCFGCETHWPGTSLLVPNGHMLLGVPTGFCRPGDPLITLCRHAQGERPWFIRLWLHPKGMEWDKFNVPVWYLYRDNILYVRTYSPRVNIGRTDVIGDAPEVPAYLLEHAINAAEFEKEMD